VFGVAFAFQLVERVPMGPLDRRVAGVVTERGVVRVRDPG
jgi:5-formyltetrahydrofolate cyclo-ligase